MGLSGPIVLKLPPPPCAVLLVTQKKINKPWKFSSSGLEKIFEYFMYTFFQILKMLQNDRTFHVYTLCNCRRLFNLIYICIYIHIYTTMYIHTHIGTVQALYSWFLLFCGQMRAFASWYTCSRNFLIRGAETMPAMELMAAMGLAGMEAVVRSSWRNGRCQAEHSSEKQRNKIPGACRRKRARRT